MISYLVFGVLLSLLFFPSTVSSSPYTSVLSLGYFHVAVIINHEAFSWGRNNQGQLGTGNTVQAMSASLPLDLYFPTEVCTGAHHTCFLDNNVVVCTGSNSQGQVGNNTKLGEFRSVLRPVPGVLDPIQKISCGTFATCAVTTTGGAFCWGSNPRGQLGIGYFESTDVPQRVVNFEYSGAFQISNGHSHSCLLATNGTVWCSGINNFGQLGLGDFSVSNSSVFLPVMGLSSPVLQIACGKYHTCALLSTGDTRCWGRNAVGQLGVGHINDSPIPLASLNNTSPVLLLGGMGPSSFSTCLILATPDQSAMCFGDNPNYKLMLPLGNIRSPTPLPNVTDLTQLQSGEDFTCIQVKNRSLEVYCVGKGEYGKLGYDNTGNSRVLVSVLGFQFTPPTPPTLFPTLAPTLLPTPPTLFPTLAPTLPPTLVPTLPPTLAPTLLVTPNPITLLPTSLPVVVFSPPLVETQAPVFPVPLQNALESDVNAIAIGVAVGVFITIVVVLTVFSTGWFRWRVSEQII